ncbi:ATP-dependent Clp protease [Klebsormidium nitens]|uniref:ATP-dependent Clp protease n=1 Tax=Klebsormidium nitens TaxID=105231 RepID=A0A1Y1HV47_KLENI|nr:ATP-dependent Clp protease [Klebsormidium nitens]|eukprot:GAQ81069.1 ATP-dependent Clp protease [Klebsormidium nitens]
MGAMAAVRPKAASMLKWSSCRDAVIGINRTTAASAFAGSKEGPSSSCCQPEVSTSYSEGHLWSREAPASERPSAKSVATSPAVFRTELLPRGLVFHKLAGHRVSSLLRIYPVGAVACERGFFTTSCSQDGVSGGGEASAVAVTSSAPPAPIIAEASTSDESLGTDMTPRQVVDALDRFIVGQADAKRAVAVALRNRWRRHKIPSPMKEEIVPKNILMIGPTGCGKTEIARRLAKLADAPFVKVEATKFTEVGFHGRDVDQIIRDLVEAAITLQKQKVRQRILSEVEAGVEEKLLDLLVGEKVGDAADDRRTRDTIRALLRAGKMENKTVDINLPAGGMRMALDNAGAGGLQPIMLHDLIVRVDKMFKSNKEKQRMTVADARTALQEVELEKHLNSDQITKDAVQSAEADGIVFIDEIDKIVISSDTRYGADASSEGVQRDLLPIIEGSVVATKYGNVSTDHILFVCSGAFHSCKPSDMLAELQGRLPIRVELKGLTRDDLYRILTEPEANMVKQQQMLMATEDITLTFSEDAIDEIATVAAEVNKSLDNIGARRLHTIIERVVEDISFNAPDRAGQEWVITREDVQKTVGDLLHKADFSKFVL